MDTVERIEEKTVFVAPDGTHHDTMDAACDHTERQDFLNFCAREFTNFLFTDGRQVGEEILERYKVTLKES